jgi:hypothetical protein
VAALRPRGLLVAIWYLTPDHDDPPPYGSTREELEGLFGSRLKLVKEWVPQASYKGREGKELVQLRRKI